MRSAPAPSTPVEMRAEPVDDSVLLAEAVMLVQVDGEELVRGGGVVSGSAASAREAMSGGLHRGERRARDGEEEGHGEVAESVLQQQVKLRTMAQAVADRESSPSMQPPEGMQSDAT